MGTIPTFPTITAGTELTAAHLASMKAVADFWALTPRGYAYQDTLATATTAVSLVMPLQAEIYDIVQSGDSPMHDNSTNNSRVVARTAGKYLIAGQVTFTNNATGVRQAFVRMNAAGASGGGTQLTLANAPALSAVPTSVPISPIIVPMAAGDYVEIFGFQNSGGNLATTPGQGLTFLSVTLDAS